ncbi:MAG: hypothetical protein VB067_08820 [Christensenellaceae bacterium]|nr:hypothetical protein [Christensenellaceae bacterium]MEA5067045.1 hypothetical protein [Eubacteriales bacterium]MEA5069075.1 hypothetical protein [Christensenellaceae bacterium]
MNRGEYGLVRLPGKGGDGYSCPASDKPAQYVLKRIRHGPCAYGRFGNKIKAKMRDYERLRKIGIPMPRLPDADVAHSIPEDEEACGKPCGRAVW